MEGLHLIPNEWLAQIQLQQASLVPIEQVRSELNTLHGKIPTESFNRLVRPFVARYLNGSRGIPKEQIDALRELVLRRGSLKKDFVVVQEAARKLSLDPEWLRKYLDSKKIKLHAFPFRPHSQFISVEDFRALNLFFSGLIRLENARKIVKLFHAREHDFISSELRDQGVKKIKLSPKMVFIPWSALCVALGLSREQLRREIIRRKVLLHEIEKLRTSGARITSFQKYKLLNNPRTTIESLRWNFIPR